MHVIFLIYFKFLTCNAIESIDITNKRKYFKYQLFAIKKSYNLSKIFNVFPSDITIIYCTLVVLYL